MINWASFLLQSLPWTRSPVLLKWSFWGPRKLKNTGCHQKGARRSLGIKGPVGFTWSLGKNQFSLCITFPTEDTQDEHSGRNGCVHLKVFAFLKTLFICFENIFLKKGRDWARLDVLVKIRATFSCQQKGWEGTSLGWEDWNPEWPRTYPAPSFKPGIPSGHQEPRPGSLPSCAFGFSGLKGEHKEEGPRVALLCRWDRNTDSSWSPVCCVWPPTYLLKPGPDRWFLTSIHSKPSDDRCLETLSFWSNVCPAEFVLFT